MDIKQIVNSKGAKGAAASAANGAGTTVQDLHLLHSYSQGQGFAPSDNGSERGGSPHDSEHSRYSAPRLGHMNGMNAQMRYPSPTAMQSPLPMMQQPYRPDNGFENGIMQPARQAPAEAVQKAFPCGTCGKGFARRSDLARHGMSMPQVAP